VSKGSTSKVITVWVGESAMSVGGVGDHERIGAAEAMGASRRAMALTRYRMV
jgi:hypothetical protein